MLASSGRSLDVTVEPGTVTEAQVPETAQGAPAGVVEIPSGWYSWDKLGNARGLAYSGMHRSWLGSTVLEMETAVGLAGEPLLECAQAIRDVGGEVVGDLRAGRWLGRFMNSTYTSHRHLHGRANVRICMRYSWVRMRALLSRRESLSNASSLAVNAEANVTGRKAVSQPQRSGARRLQSAIRRRERLETQLLSSEYALRSRGRAMGGRLVLTLESRPEIHPGSKCDKRSNLMRWNRTDRLAARCIPSDCYQARDPDVKLVTATIDCQRASSSCLFCC
jgi:hypothetical protein